MRAPWKLLPLPSLALLAFSATALSTEADFGYACENCPAAWPELEIADNNCGGIEQSPIALSDGDAEFTPRIRLRVRYHGADLAEEIRLTNVEYKDQEPGGSVVRLGRARYAFDQPHFHSTAEHVINGERSALEMHFVNRAANGAVLVLAVFIREGRQNPAFEPIVDVIDGPDVMFADEVEVELGDLLPEDLASFRYTGSTTTPPCTAGVNWVLLREHVELSQDQIHAIQSAIRDGLNDGFNNNRPIQNRELRSIAIDSPAEVPPGYTAPEVEPPLDSQQSVR
jgi:carbonic anhydrase